MSGKQLNLERFKFFLKNYPIIIFPAILLFALILFTDRITPYFRYTVIALAIIIFIFSLFEASSVNTRRFAVMCLLCSFAVISRCAFFMIPYVKPFLALIILSSAFLGPIDGFILGSLSCMISNVFLGQGPWTIWQMLASGLSGLISGFIFRTLRLRVSRVKLAVLSGIIVFFIYSPIVDFSSFILFSPDIYLSSFVTFLITSLPANIIHTCSTIFFSFFLAKKFIHTMESHNVYK